MGDADARFSFISAEGKSMTELMDLDSFYSQHDRKMFYVGFLKACETWVPLCSVSNSASESKFDTLLVSASYEEMDQLLKAYAEKLPKVEHTFVHYLMREEINNIMQAYALKHVELTHDVEASGCGCGCGCS